MFHETLPPPYAEAWDRLRRESHHYAQEFARQGVPVWMRRRISPPEAEADTINWANIESVTYQETYVRLQVPDIVDRVCGIVPREELYHVGNAYQGYPIRRQRQLCPEYEQALRLMMESNSPALHAYMYTGIPVRDSQYFGSEPRREDDGIIRVGPMEVFQAMHVCDVTIPPQMYLFYGECRRQDEDWNRGAGPTGPVWHGQYPYQALQQQDVYNQALNARRDALASMAVTGAWDPSYYPWFGNQDFWANTSRTSTPEQIAAREEASRLAKISKERGLALVERVVTPEEFKSFNDNKYIELTGKKYRYRIKQAGQTALYNLKSGVVEQNACLQLTDNTAPTEDRVVMEYLMIKNKENKYLKAANLFPTGIGIDAMTQIAAARLYPSIADSLFNTTPLWSRLRSGIGNIFSGGS